MENSESGFETFFAVGTRVRIELPDQSLRYGEILAIDQEDESLFVRTDCGEVLNLYPYEVTPVARVPIYKTSLPQNFDRYKELLGRPDKDDKDDKDGEPLPYPTPLSVPLEHSEDPLTQVFKPLPDDALWDYEGELSDSYVKEVKSLSGITPKYSSYSEARGRRAESIRQGTTEMKKTNLCEAKGHEPEPIKNYTKALEVVLGKIQKDLEKAFDIQEEFEIDWGQEPNYAKLINELATKLQSTDDILVDIKAIIRKIR